jgi:hypothetical protein
MEADGVDALQAAIMGSVPVPAGVRLVSANVFRRRERLITADEVAPCSCRERDGASEWICAPDSACENVAVRGECLQGFCSKTRCVNQRLQRRA